MTLSDVDALARRQGLSIFGAFHPTAEDGAPEGTGTLVLLGPDEPGFWALATGSPEFADGVPDPLDRWSERVVSALARDLGAQPLFPFGGPPWQPFIRWAKASGRAWASPVTLLVHDRAGLMVSYRGALAFGDRLDLPAPPQRPCDSCAEKPCLTACPVTALTDRGYDTAACHGFLDTARGTDCMQQGCQVRRACPLSQSYGRVAAQSAFHMATFHK